MISYAVLVKLLNCYCFKLTCFLSFMVNKDVYLRRAYRISIILNGYLRTILSTYSRSELICRSFSVSKWPIMCQVRRLISIPSFWRLHCAFHFVYPSVCPMHAPKGRFPLPEFTARVHGPRTRPVNSGALFDTRQLGPSSRVSKNAPEFRVGPS